MEAHFYDTDLKAAREALQLITIWNAEGFVDGMVKINVPEVWTFNVNSSEEYKGRKVLMEPFITHYQKFNSNTGWTDERVPWARVMQALSHFSYHVSEGNRLLCDLQGGAYADGVVLTDPVVMSSTREFGPTDLGPEGISTFFANHQCNEYCRTEWIRPKIETARFASVASTTMKHVPSSRSRQPMSVAMQQPESRSRQPMSGAIQPMSTARQPLTRTVQPATKPLSAYQRMSQSVQPTSRGVQPTPKSGSFQRSQSSRAVLQPTPASGAVQPASKSRSAQRSHSSRASQPASMSRAAQPTPTSRASSRAAQPSPTSRASSRAAQPAPASRASSRSAQPLRASRASSRTGQPAPASRASSRSRQATAEYAKEA
mmetsp:Transcript_8268/g.21730  ORF Transcript_8268/g.21730 Transcript_8268/m.21730 type:complete len:373 (-) Transcript_8268:150-1268(-)